MPIHAKCDRCGDRLGVLADELPTVEVSCPTCADRLRRWTHAYLTPRRRMDIKLRGGYSFCDDCADRLFGECDACYPDEVRKLSEIFRAPAFEPPDSLGA